jgi:hypothetical protein
MNMATKKSIFERYLKEYLRADPARKSKILDHVVDVIGVHRKSAIRKFRALQLRDSGKQETRGRPVYYTKDVDAALYDIWQVANEPCGELLFPLVQEYVSIFIRDDQWKHSDEATGKLLSMKEHTARRRVRGFEKKYGDARGLSSTKPSHLKSIIPIFKGPWHDLPPGHGQLDTVAHCGATLLGDFMFTLNYTDATTYWIVPRAQWNKGAEATMESMKSIKNMLPIPWLGAHPDTGSEFINWVAKKWFDAEKINLTRSEPGKKNDNMYVEERNGHVVRKYLGYTRFDNKDVVARVNELYDVLTLYLNHFQAVRRTLEKKRVGAKYVRTYEKVPKTPYQRMLDHSEVSKAVKDELRIEHEKLNPLDLKKKVDILTTKIMKLQRAAAKPKMSDSSR